MPKISLDLIDQLVSVGYRTNIAMVAEIGDMLQQEVIGVGRIAKYQDSPKRSELGVIVADDFHQRGLGSRLTKCMLYIAKDLGYAEVHALVKADNFGMQNILSNQHFIAIGKGMEAISFKLVF